MTKLNLGTHNHNRDGPWCNTKLGKDGPWCDAWPWMRHAKDGQLHWRNQIWPQRDLWKVWATTSARCDAWQILTMATSSFEYHQDQTDNGAMYIKTSCCKMKKKIWMKNWTKWWQFPLEYLSHELVYTKKKKSAFNVLPWSLFID